MASGSLQGFVNAAEEASSAGSCVSVAPGLVVSVSSPVVVSSPAVLDFNGATLNETGSIAWLLTATAAVTMSDFSFKGDGSGGGLYCEGATCEVDNGNVSDMTDGMRVDSAGSLTVSGSTADSDTDGITARGLGVVNVSATSADNDTSTGFDLSVAGEHSSISGSADNDMIGLLVNGGSHLSIGDFSATGDNHFGVDIANSSDGTATSLTATDTGTAAGSFGPSSSGAGIELNPVSGWTFSSITATGQLGYGVAIAGSSHNTFDSIVIDRGTSQGSTNPGLNLDHSTSDNHFHNVSVTGQTVGVLIGGSGAKLPTGQTGNTGNVFDVLDLAHDTFAGISIPGGNANIFMTVNATDVNSSYPAPDRAQVRFYGAHCFDNTIVTYNSIIDAARAGKVAFYVVYADALAKGNTVNLGKVDAAGSYKVAPFDTERGANTFTGPR
jgi:hypothetical protein